ncbi:MAG: phospho-N-acetylmuramoyl-pentapeptide-transferase, partial [Planctomycetota bacterium]
MLYWLFDPLVTRFPGFYLFRFVSFRAAFAAILAFLVVVVCAPGVLCWLRERRIGERQKHDSETLADLHSGKEGVPTMGGLLVLLSVTVSILLLARLDNLYVVLVLLTFLALGALGAVDDWIKLRRPDRKGVSERHKLLGQFAVAGAAVLVLYVEASHGSGEPLLRGPSLEPTPYPDRIALADAGASVRRETSPDLHLGPTDVGHPRADHRTDLQVPLFKHFCLDLGLLFLVLGAFVIVGTSNAVNLADGLDGLAAGCMAVAALTFGLVTYIVGRADTAEYLYVFNIPGAVELAVVCAALAGAGLGFLWFNGYPATVFMGDTGSLALGGTLGLVAVIV